MLVELIFQTKIWNLDSLIKSYVMQIFAIMKSKIIINNLSYTQEDFELFLVFFKSFNTYR